MARRVEEGDLVTVLGGDLVGADMLGDATGLARHDVGLAERVQKRGLAVVHMAHDGDHGRARREILVLILCGFDDVLHIRFRDADQLVAKLVDDQLGRFRVDGLVLGRHDAHLHQRLDDVGDAFGHAVGEFLHRDRVGQAHFAHDLFALDRAAHHLAPLALLAPPHRGQRALAAALVLAELRDR